MKILTKIQYTFPQFNERFTNQFLNYFSPQGAVTKNKILLNKTKQEYLPDTVINFSNVEIPKVGFEFDDSSTVEVEIKNTTGITKSSPHSYSPIDLDEYLDRVSDIPVFRIDHTGFNLPFFEGIHPKILELRSLLKDTCLYHTFPKELADEPWDFIIPASEKEIIHMEKINYNLIRQPKVEIVSFPKSSTPIFQIDLQIKEKYEDFKKMFPEGIDVPDIKCVWVYIKNEIGIDVCFVINEAQDSDWSHYFSNSRLR